MNTSKIDALAMAAEARAEVDRRRGNGFKTGETGAATTRLSIPNGGHSHSLPASSMASANRKRKPNFAEKLHVILADNNCSSSIAWLPSGKSFCILNKEEFTRHVLPLYFREAKFESFSRRIKRWGFRKIYTTGQKNIVLTHDLFQKGRLDLCKMMNGRSGQSGNMAIQDTYSHAATTEKSELEVLAQVEKTLPTRNQTNAAPQAMQQERALRLNPSYVPLVLPQAQRMVVGVPASTRNPCTTGQMHGTMMGTFQREASITIDARRPYQARPSAVPHGIHGMDVSGQMSAVDEEIADCQEQLEILYRLRSLRERRRALS